MKPLKGFYGGLLQASGILQVRRGKPLFAGKDERLFKQAAKAAVM
jgi:hypothetical protein